MKSKVGQEDLWKTEAQHELLPNGAKSFYHHTCPHHYDVIKWKYFPRYWHFMKGIHRSPVDSPLKGQWRGAFMFSLTCAWTIGWVNIMYVMYVTDDMWCYEPLKSAVLTNHTCHWYYYYYVIRSCVICHGGSHASGACLNGNLHTKSIVFKWSLVHDH